MFRFNVTYRPTSVANLSDIIEDLEDRLHRAETSVFEWRELEAKAQCDIRHLQEEIQRKSQ